MSRFGWSFLCLLLFSGWVASPVSAQEPGPTRRNMISGNPFGWILEWYNLEYERATGEHATVAVSASYVDPGDDDTLLFTNLGLRYYPRSALHGFFVGGRLGVVHVETSTDSGTGISFGFELAYTWLLGDDDNLGLSLGFGLNRIFGGDIDTFTDSDGDDFPVIWPNFRVNLGWAF